MSTPTCQSTPTSAAVGGSFTDSIHNLLPTACCLHCGPFTGFSVSTSSAPCSLNSDMAARRWILTDPPSQLLIHYLGALCMPFIIMNRDSLGFPLCTSAHLRFFSGMASTGYNSNSKMSQVRRFKALIGTNCPPSRSIFCVLNDIPLTGVKTHSTNMFFLVTFGGPQGILNE